jgi:acyl-CoA thioester hydrolase
MQDATLSFVTNVELETSPQTGYTHPFMAPHVLQHRLELRVRYSETDQLGTFYNSRALEWFECGRTELLRSIGLPYAQMEERGVFLPLVEAHVNYRGRAKYDDLLAITSRLTLAGRASLRFDVEILMAGAGGARVADGYTLHAITDNNGKPMRCPDWLEKALSDGEIQP